MKKLWELFSLISLSLTVYAHRVVAAHNFITRIIEIKKYYLTNTCSSNHMKIERSKRREIIVIYMYLYNTWLNVMYKWIKNYVSIILLYISSNVFWLLCIIATVKLIFCRVETPEISLNVQNNFILFVIMFVEKNQLVRLKSKIYTRSITVLSHAWIKFTRSAQFKHVACFHILEKNRPLT
jgi:hypothetical protein